MEYPKNATVTDALNHYSGANGTTILNSLTSYGAAAGIVLNEYLCWKEFLEDLHDAYRIPQVGDDFTELCKACRSQIAGISKRQRAKLQKFSKAKPDKKTEALEAAEKKDLVAIQLRNWIKLHGWQVSNEALMELDVIIKNHVKSKKDPNKAYINRPC